MTIALTGATGFVGKAVLKEALRREETARALTRREQPPREGVEWVAGDLSDGEALASLCTDTDAIVHVAGLTNAPDPAAFEDANVGGTERLIAAAKAAKVKRFVFVSSLSAREPKLSAYGASKAQAEKRVEASGLNWTIVRPPGVYGPHDVDYFEMFRSAKFGLVPLPPGGASSIIHVEDLARLLLDLVDASPALVRRRTFEPDDGREGGWSHKELAKAIGKAVGRPVFAPHLPRAVLEAAARADRLLRGDKARLTADRVGYMTHPNWVARSSHKVPEAVWSPRIGGEEGLKTTAEWYRAQGWL
ncbi:NAD-dependent epimerase/dehydratase family protein [Qipengyuania flava]|uniref:NAD-dependent epimerase/dehydratase family protein n=1 Tax=Qipengyuania flava TaxID=192812 RepID=UPI001C62CB43|nr:NAD(P)H-binding protein [Qipengyuania flava]QYJ06700.1 NAD(P)H-binding protein [Qipengyuania flava]